MSNLRGFSSKIQFFDPNCYVNVPPPPLPPSFPPTNIPPVPPRFTSFPPPSRPSYPPFSHQQFQHHSGSGRPVFSSTSRECGIPPPNGNSVNYRPPLEENSSKDSGNIQDWVDQWAKNKMKLKDTNSDIKIHTVKNKLNAAFKLIRELENSSLTLGVMVKTVSSSEWEQKCEEVEQMKIKLLRLLDELKLTDADFKSLKEKLSKRRKKRARLRRQSQRLNNQREQDKVKEQNLNFQIDNMLREMQDGVERVKREEDLKKEADAVLWGVTQKKTEAKRQVAMLSALLTLRSVRVARLTAAGLPVSQTQIQTFNTVIERLKNMWSRYLEECQLEEQALRGMLGVDADPAMDPVKTHRKLVLNKWETAIFGSVGTVEPSLKTEELINIRRAWDRFAVPTQSLLASAVPPGYVLPVPPSDDIWKSFLRY